MKRRIPSYMARHFLIGLVCAIGMTVLLTNSASAISGLDFPSNGGSTVQFRFTGTSLLNPWPATYIWRIKPRQQTGYYTTFFWGNMAQYGDMRDFQYNYYGAHPYPQGGSSGTVHNWEISYDGQDYITDKNGNSTVVEKGRWFTQAFTVRNTGSNNIEMTFYWDLGTSTGRVIQTTRANYGSQFPPDNPGLCFGDATWSPGNELLSGILRGVQIYSTNLSITEILSEIDNPLSTPAGANNIWYMNLNPTPTDISDKSGKGHHPVWFGSKRPALYTESDPSPYSQPATPGNLRTE
jgi:hypothetical protein